MRRVKPLKAFWLVLAMFGLVNCYDAIGRFGWQAVDLPPVKFWAFQVWVTARNIVSFTLLALVPIYVLGRKSRWIVFIAFILTCVIEFAVEYSSKVFHADLADEWINLIANTNAAEMVSFLGMVMGIVPILCVLLALLVLVWVWHLLAKADYPKFCVKNLVLGILFVVPFVVLNMLTMNWHFGIAQMRYTDFMISTVNSQVEMRGIKNACANVSVPKSVQTLIPCEQLPDVVVVIGESFTRNNWHLYGYGRNTSPRLDALRASGDVIVYTDVVGTHPVTLQAVALLLTDADAFQKQKGGWTLAELYRLAGYRTVLVSNQYGGSDDHTLLAKSYSGCEKLISGWVELPSESRYDAELVPLMASELEASGNHPTALFLHLKGAHFPVKDANPLSDVFFDDNVEPTVLAGLSAYDRDRRNRYDNALRYGDKVLGMIIDVLSRRNRPSCLFYVSDHGESPRSRSWRDYAAVDVYELPCFVWLSKQYRERFPDVAHKIIAAKDRPVQPYEMTTGLFEIGLIIPPAGSAKSFLDQDFQCHQPRKINKGRTVYR